MMAKFRSQGEKAWKFYVVTTKEAGNSLTILQETLFTINQH